MHFVYVLWSEKLRKRYTGYSEDVEARFEKHNSGKSTYTKRGIPWKIIHIEEFQTKSEAMQRELYLKTGIGRDWLSKKYPQYT